MSSCLFRQQIRPKRRLRHLDLLIGGGGGGGGLLLPGAGFGDAPPCLSFKEMFRLEGGGFGSLAIFSSFLPHRPRVLS